MIKVSVIIPCYNAGKYIKECLDSIFSQTLDGIEVICVDDGSRDDTFDILEEYHREFEYMHIIQQDNQGPGIARNCGIKIARGEFLAFMDADDFYPSKDILEIVYNIAKSKRAEICGGSMCSYHNGAYMYEGFRKGYTFLDDAWIKKENFPTMGGYTKFLFKRNLIIENQISFPDYYRFEDPVFFLTAIARAGGVYCMKMVTYVYRKEHKRFLYTMERAVEYIKGLRDCLVISKEEGMQVVFAQLLSELHGESSALMYLYSSECEEMNGLMQQINEIIMSADQASPAIAPLKVGKELADYINNISTEKQQFLKSLRNNKKVLIFGAGTVGKKVWAFLKRNCVEVEAFVVSDIKQNAKSLDGLQVKCIDDYLEKKDKCKVIIASFPYLQIEIKDILHAKGFWDIYSFSVEKLYLFEGKVEH